MIDKKISEDYSTKFVWGLFDLIYTKTLFSRSEISSLLFVLSLYKDDLITNYIIDSRNLNDDLLNLIRKSNNSNKKYYEQLLSEFIWNLNDLKKGDGLNILFEYLEKQNKELFKDKFFEIFDLSLQQIAQSQANYSFGEFYQPKELTRLMCNLGDVANGFKVYNPFAGLASFDINFDKSVDYYGQEINQKIWALGLLNLIVHNKDASNFALDDSISNWPNNPNTYDLVISNPPFGIRFKNNKYRRIENFFLDNGWKLLNKNGKFISLFPDRILSSNSREERLIRETLVENDLVDTVISLPSGIIANTGIKLSLLVLNKNKQIPNQIRYVNAESFVIEKSRKEKILDFASILDLLANSDTYNEKLIYVDNKDAIQNNYDLSVHRYFIKQPENGVPLGAILTPIHGNRIPELETFNLVKISNLKNNIIDFEIDVNSIESYENSNNRRFEKIEEDCLLLTTRFKNLKPTFFKFSGEPLYIDGQNISAFKIDDTKVDVKYLIKELLSDYVLKQVEAYSKGTAITFLSRNDLLNIKINLPSLEEQKSIYLKAVNKDFSNEKKQLFEKYEEQITDINDENSFLRHQIAGSIKDIKSSLKMLNKILESKVEPVISNVFELKFSEDMSNNLGGYLNSMNNHLISIEKSMKTVKKQIELSDLTIEEFDLLKFIKDYYAHLQIREDKNYSVELELDELTLQDANLKKVIVNADKTRLKQAFDNLVENAVKHAFEINQPNKLLIQLLFDLEDSRVQIDFSNTGNPLPENVSHESLVRKGSTIGENGGDGIGLWFVNDMMKLFGGKFGFTDETGSEGIDGEYVTSMELTLPIITTYEKI